MLGIWRFVTSASICILLYVHYLSQFSDMMHYPPTARKLLDIFCLLTNFPQLALRPVSHNRDQPRTQHGVNHPGGMSSCFNHSRDLAEFDALTVTDAIKSLCRQITEVASRPKISPRSCRSFILNNWNWRNLVFDITNGSNPNTMSPRVMLRWFNSLHI